MILHVACLPFPSYQGTQAALAAMLEASAGTGRPTHLLTYAQGAYPLDAPYEVHRIPDFPKVRSLRSGPSWGKIGLDVRCIVETRRLARRIQPTAIVAHHIEAAFAALAAQVAPVYYVAHTCLARELPVYLPSLPTRLVSGVAQQLEAIVCARAAGVAAVAPSLADLLGRGVRYLPVPWAASAALRPTRSEARATLGLSADAHICLYAGNLDRYQGWEHLIEALAILRHTDPRARLLVATESDPAPAGRRAKRLRVSDFVHFCRIDGEPSRWAALHDTGDVHWLASNEVILRSGADIAASASAALWCRPSAFRVRSSNACTPRLNRLMPICRNAANPARSAGLASAVTSASGATDASARTALRMRSRVRSKKPSSEITISSSSEESTRKLSDS